jgi:transcriptional regulator with XRE-family HTH domain
LEYEEKIIRAKKRIEYLRKIHGLRKQDICSAMGFTRQHYHQDYKNSAVLSVKSLIGITNLFGISEYDLLHSEEYEFLEIPIVKAYLEYSKATVDYEKLKLGIWDCEPFIEM